MTARLLIVGATGFVGSNLAIQARGVFDVIGASRTPSAGGSSVAIEITDEASVVAAFAQARPAVVIHLAALSDIDRCQREQELARRINVDGAGNVARACSRAGARLIFTSTDAVFDGTKGFYREDDVPSPANWYGQTKVDAERAVAALVPSAAIVRSSLVLGRSAAAGGNSYLEKVVGNLRAGNPIISPTFEVRNPIDVGTLSAWLIELAAAEQASGIFHAGASDKISRYDLARAIAERLGYDPSLIVAQQAPVPGRAPRGADDFLGGDRLSGVCRTPVPTCREVIERVVPWNCLKPATSSNSITARFTGPRNPRPWPKCSLRRPLPAVRG